MLIDLVQAILSGLLVGGVYGLFSVGFSLAFGVMRIVNFAHGEFVVIGMFVGYVFATITGLDPLFAVPLAGVIVALLGIPTYLGVYSRFVGRASLSQLLAAIAIALIVQNLLQLIFGSDTRAAQSPIGSQYIVMGPFFFSLGQVAAFGIALICIVLLEVFLRTTHWGSMVQAVADDIEAAELVGVNSRYINLTAFCMSCGLAGVAGGTLVSYYPVSPATGFTLMPIALIATVLGGMGSVSGAFVSGIACAIIQQLTSAFISVPLQDLPLYALFLLILAFRPTGLFGTAMK